VGREGTAVVFGFATVVRRRGATGTTARGVTSGRVWSTGSNCGSGGATGLTTGAGSDCGSDTFVHASAVRRSVFDSDVPDGTLGGRPPVGNEMGKDPGQHGVGGDAGVDAGIDVGRELGTDRGRDSGADFGVELGTDPRQHPGDGSDLGVEWGSEWCGECGDDDGRLSGTGADGAYWARHSRLRWRAASACAVSGKPTSPIAIASSSRAALKAPRRAVRRPTMKARSYPRRGRGRALTAEVFLRFTR
jgi:hypothetical protein